MVRGERFLTMPRTILTIEGMTCDHCVQAVGKALASLPGVVEAQVSLPLKQATITYEGELDLEATQKAVEEEGYRVLSKKVL